MAEIKSKSRIYFEAHPELLQGLKSDSENFHIRRLAKILHEECVYSKNTVLKDISCQIRKELRRLEGLSSIPKNS